MLAYIVSNAPLFLLIAVRCLALIMTVPLFSMRSVVSKIVKVALAGYFAYLVFPHVASNNSYLYSVYSSYISSSGEFNLQYILLLVGEALIGILMGFYVTIIFAAFSTAGQFFAFQMGFSASEVYDALSQVENPLMGQYLNLVAMLVFLQTRWFQLLFGGALVASFNSLSAFSIVVANENIMHFFLVALSNLFVNALTLALPIIGTLTLIMVAMGMLSKAAPQMNLFSEGFSITMLVTFFLITVLMPQMCDFFVQSFVSGFKALETLFTQISEVKIQ
ncbi:MAG: flagellar biosynthetic protein FliR [Treponema sp.]|nr:flagellar biosynthetic protein FliR [Treponema sp.]